MKMLKCKKCGFEFKDRSEMMSHIRKEHPWDTTKQLKKARAARKTPAKTEKAALSSKELVLANALVNGRASLQMTLKKDKLTLNDLLARLKTQRDFMIDVVNLIEGMIV